METSTETVRDTTVSAPTPALPSGSAVGGTKSRAKKNGAAVSTGKTTKQSSKKASHAERVENAVTELNDLIDEHEAELREVKDRVQAALSRTGALRKAVKSAVKEVSVNSELESELADLRKKFESVRNLVG